MPLPKNAPASAWIHDFVKSTNSKFKGKSKKERIKMALGAYYGKQNEERAAIEARINENYVPRANETHHDGDCPACKKVYSQEKKGGMSHREASELARYDHEMGHSMKSPHDMAEGYLPEARSAGDREHLDLIGHAHNLAGAVIGHHSTHHNSVNDDAHPHFERAIKALEQARHHLQKAYIAKIQLKKK